MTGRRAGRCAWASKARAGVVRASIVMGGVGSAVAPFAVGVVRVARASARAARAARTSASCGAGADGWAPADSGAGDWTPVYSIVGDLAGAGAWVAGGCVEGGVAWGLALV